MATGAPLDRRRLPQALRETPLDRLSSGMLMLLDRDGDLVAPPRPGNFGKQSPATLVSPVSNASLGIPLDARIGSNIRLGDDPPSLPGANRAQAEPHIARHPLDPDLLAAIFQEGRYTDGGAVDCGYAISHDGGLSWSRALIPWLTKIAGGPYDRASDPVVGIDLNGNIFLNTLAIGSTTAVLVSRSTDGGVSFDPPVVAYQPNGTAPDKNWMTINNFTQTATAGRIVVTVTLFGSGYYPIVCTFSDDRGDTWSAPSYVTPATSYVQGSQPFFLPNGNLAVVYWNFLSDRIQISTSTDGGATFGPGSTVTYVNYYAVPGIRSGAFLPSATADRTLGHQYITYQGLHQGNPRILFTKSVDEGVTWSVPVPVSDNPANTPVFNPAISVSPDGQRVTIVFYDQRVNGGLNYLVDTFLAQSIDGGNTWQPNLRLTPVSSDASLAPLTSSGYMLGDYLGIAASNSADIPAVPVWIDTRTGNSDPFVARVGIAPQLTFQNWRAARLSAAQIADPLVGGMSADPNADGMSNLLAYALGRSPWIPDTPGIAANVSGGLATMTYQRLSAVTDVVVHAYRSTDLANPNGWTNGGVTEMLLTDDGVTQTWQATAPIGTGPGTFMRLRATAE